MFMILRKTSVKSCHSNSGTVGYPWEKSVKSAKCKPCVCELLKR